MDFTQVDAITIPQGGVKQLEIDGDVVWRKYTARSYVQDGLIAMWDGRENAGWGVHTDSIATEGWTDLVNGVTLRERTVTYGGAVITPLVKTRADCVVFKGGITGSGRVMLQANAASFPQIVNMLNSVRNGFYTEQVLGERYLVDNSALLISAQLVNTGDTYRRAIHYFDTYQSGSSYHQFVAQNYNNKYISAGGWTSGFDGTPCTFSFMRTLSMFTLWRNGDIFRQTTNACNTAPTCTQGSIIFNYASYETSPFNATVPMTDNMDLPVHCVRIYSRALTAEEIAHNYAIDKERFNLP